LGFLLNFKLKHQGVIVLSQPCRVLERKLKGIGKVQDTSTVELKSQAEIFGRVYPHEQGAKGKVISAF
jgi:hypothetical protein